MELKYLKLVKTIADEGNISKSAGRLFLTQSALSHQLKDFEERIGIKVFIRSRNDWKLTKEGQEVYEMACQVIDRIDEGMSRITKIQTGSRGMIKLGTECYSFYHGLPAFIQKMNVLYPEIDINLNIESGQPVSLQLLNKELDMCIVTTPLSNDQITNYELFSDELFALMSSENELADKEYLEPTDFLDQHLIIHSYPIETVSVHKHFLKMNQVNPMKITAVPMTEVAIELIEANMGIACYSKWALKNFKLSESLKFVPLGKNGLRRTHNLSIRTEDQNKQYIQDFIENIREDTLLTSFNTGARI